MSSLSFSVVRNHDFRLMMFSRAFVMMALQAQDVIIGWQIYSLTKDPFMLGLIGLTEAVPAIACAFIAGHIVDISRPHRVFVLAMSALTLNMTTLLLIAGGLVATPGGNVIPWLFSCIFISGLARSFLMPSSFALLPQIIPRGQIAAASAWFGSSFQIAAISSPAIAGIIYGGYGVTVAWVMPSALMFSALVLLLGMSTHPRNYKSAERREPAAKSIKAGWQFIWHNPVLLSIMSLDMFAVLFGGAVAMLPAYADQVLHVGSEGLGQLRAAPAIGAVLTSLVLAVRPFKMIRATTLLTVVAGFGLSIIAFGLSTHFGLSMVFLALSGAFDSVSMVIRGTLVQLLTPDAMRGRVSSVNSIFIISSNEIGAFESGLSAKLLGLVPSVIFGGCCTLLVVGATAILSPKFRKTVVDTSG